MARLTQAEKDQHPARFSRYRRGTVWPNSPVYGYAVTCECGWKKRVNGTRREAEGYWRDHVLDARKVRPAERSCCVEYARTGRQHDPDCDFALTGRER